MPRYRKVMFIVCAISVSAALCLEPSRDVSAQARSAMDVVSSVQAFYRSRGTMSARFQQHFWNKIYRRTQSSSGRIVVQRPGRIRFEYAIPAGQVFVSDGATWTMFQPIDGTAGQYARGTTSEAIASSLGILTGTVDFDAFHVALRPLRAEDPADTDTLVMAPTQRNPHYRRLVLYIVSAPADVRGMVRSIRIEDYDGNWNRFVFETPQFGVPVEPGVFQFTPPVGARELRGR